MQHKQLKNQYKEKVQVNTSKTVLLLVSSSKNSGGNMNHKTRTFILFHMYVYICFYLFSAQLNSSIAITILHQQMAKVISLMLRSSASPVI